MSPITPPISTVNVPGSTWTNFDFVTDAQSQLERVGSTWTALCASFETVRQLSEVKQFTGTTATSNEPLLQAGDGDVTQATPRNIFGAQLWSLPEGTIADGTVWALDRDKVYAVLRSDIKLMVDPSFFSGPTAWLCGASFVSGSAIRITRRFARSPSAVAGRRLISVSSQHP
jgi:hypothetical protein